MDLREGLIIKTYRLTKKLGDGASGEVWQARDLDSPRDVAIKLMHTHLFESPQSIHRDRFEREIEAVLTLGEHPNIPTFYDKDLEYKPPYFAMQYIRGAGVDTIIQEAVINRIPIQKRIEIIKQISDALAYAHREGYIHRDIKPSNVKIIGDDTAYLLDFSVAFAEEDTSKTQLGIGTPLYMPPEVFPSKAGDIFSLALVAFEILYGRHAIFRENDIIMNSADAKRLMDERLMDLTWEQPSQLPALKGLSENANYEALDRVFVRALAHKPTDRYDDANEFSNALEEALAPAILQLDASIQAADTDPFGIGTPPYQEDRTQFIASRETELVANTHTTMPEDPAAVLPAAAGPVPDKAAFNRGMMLMGMLLLFLLAAGIIAALTSNDRENGQQSNGIVMNPTDTPTPTLENATAEATEDNSVVALATEAPTAEPSATETASETASATATYTATEPSATPSRTPSITPTAEPTLADTLAATLEMIFDGAQDIDEYPCYTLAQLYEFLQDADYDADSDYATHAETLLSASGPLPRIYNFCRNNRQNDAQLPSNLEEANDELLDLIRSLVIAESSE